MKPQPTIIIFVALTQSAFAQGNNDDIRLQHFLFPNLEELISLETTVGTPQQFQNSGNHTFRHQDDNANRSFDMPDQEAYLLVDWGFPPEWNRDLQTNWIDDLPRAPGNNRQAVDDYFIIDSTINYAGFESWELAASVRNLFDVDAQEYTGKARTNDLPLPKCNYYAEIHYKL